MSKPIKPLVTLASLKRLAHRIKLDDGLKQSEALNAAAQRHGYQNYAHARRTIEAAATEGPSSPPPQRPAVRGLTDYQAEARRKWEAVMADTRLGPIRASRSWDDLDSIVRLLDLTLGATNNHVLLPTGGGMDMVGAVRSHEPGCLELRVRRGLAYVVKPRRLVLERFPDALAESFFILEAEPLDLADVEGEDFLDEERDAVLSRRRTRGSEEILELAPRHYVPRSVWDDGNLGIDSNGDKIPLPSGARVVVRWLNGRFMFLSTGSLWNGVPATYDGRHDRLTTSAIRAQIQDALEMLSETA